MVTLSAPGYYRIIAAAVDSAGGLLLPDGRFVQNAIYREAWIWVDEHGSRRHSAFEPSALPDTVVHQPGVRRLRRAAAPAGQSAVLQDDYIFYGRLVAYDNDAQMYRPVGGAFASVSIYDHYAGEELPGYSFTTAADGTFDMYCHPYEEHSASFSLPSSAVALSPSSIGGVTTYNYCPDGDVHALSAPVEVFNNFVRVSAGSALLLGRTRPKLTVVLSASQGSYYTASTDQVTVRNGTAGSDDVWGDWGVFVAGHEYGHAAHERALGGNVAGGSCPSPHSLGGASNLKCAYSEGFATWHAAMAEGTRIGGILASLENNAYYTTGANGSIVEGAVASLLYDLTDPANETQDQIQYPGTYLADLVRTCETRGVLWTRADGIDHLIYCMERLVDPAVTGSSVFFTTRTTDPAYQREGATEPASWSQASIRALWRWVLYGSL